MKRPNMRKAFAGMAIVSLALAVSLTYGLMNGRPANAKSEHNPSNISGKPGTSEAPASAAASSSAINLAAQDFPPRLPKTPIYALSSTRGSGRNFDFCYGSGVKTQPGANIKGVTATDVSPVGAQRRRSSAWLP